MRIVSGLFFCEDISVCTEITDNIDIPRLGRDVVARVRDLARVQIIHLARRRWQESFDWLLRFDTSSAGREWIHGRFVGMSAAHDSQGTARVGNPCYTMLRRHRAHRVIRANGRSTSAPRRLDRNDRHRAGFTFRPVRSDRHRVARQRHCGRTDHAAATERDITGRFLVTLESRISRLGVSVWSSARCTDASAPSIATLSTFLFSGLVHDLVISVPAARGLRSADSLLPHPGRRRVVREIRASAGARVRSSSAP